MLAKLLTEQQNPASAEIDRLPTDEVLRIINEEDRKVAGAVADAIPQLTKVVDAVVAATDGGGRLFYIGAGTSGRLGVLDASECPPTYNVPYDLVQGIIAGGAPALSRATEASEDKPESGAADLMAHGFTNKDVLIGIAASGRTPYVLGAIQKANELGAVTAGISCSPKSELSQAAKIPVEILTGPEVITGSTRMKAGTGTKLALNMITTAAMIRLGYVFGNLMVNVQPRNEKLVDRARRIISQAAGISHDEAARLLAEAGDVKTAIVMVRRAVDRATAVELLARSRGRIRQALES